MERPTKVEKTSSEMLAEVIETVKGSDIEWLLKEISKSPAKMEIIDHGLNAAGINWPALRMLPERKDAAAALGHLVSFWDTPREDGEPRGFEDHLKEAEAFAELLC